MGRSRYDVLVVGAGPAGLSTAVKCAEMSYRVLVLERGRPGRVKPCAGVTLEVTLELLQTDLGLKLPQGLLAQPPRLGLYLIGPRSGGRVRNYRLVNLVRPMLDLWLSIEAMRRGVELRFSIPDTRWRSLGRGSS